MRFSVSVELAVSVVGLIFAVPEPSVPDRDLILGRQDLRVIVARESAAERVANDAWKDYLPSVTALFTPQVLAPAGLFANARSWRASVLFTVPLLVIGVVGLFFMDSSNFEPFALESGFDWGIIGGGSFSWAAGPGDILFDIRYDLGMVKIGEADGAPDRKNTSFQFLLGYAFPM